MKTVLKKHWYITLLAILSTVNACLCLLVRFDVFAVIWTFFALALSGLLAYYYKKETK